MINLIIVVLLTIILSGTTWSCDNEFHGFGVHLGSIGHFNSTRKDTIQKVIDKIYVDLKIRYFRTSYEPYFSPSEGIYKLSCDQPTTENCTWSWEAILQVLSNKQRYGDIDIIASVWAPPLYLMNTTTLRLLPEKEMDYYYYLKNITALIKEKYDLSVTKISPVNEPENIWATWNHCNMDPSQLCRMVINFNDPLVALCTENSYFWVTELYLKYKNRRMGIDCLSACKTVATHAYKLDINSTSPNYGLAYYDLLAYENPFKHHHHKRLIWMTEVSSTFPFAEEEQMSEALDLAMNLINFVGVTCVERYYFWSAFTTISSGESLIWGSGDEATSLKFPKKYFVYNHFTNASSDLSPNVTVRTCAETNFVQRPGDCLFFTNKSDNITVFTNRGDEPLHLKSHAHTLCKCGLCCTTMDSDLTCDPSNWTVLPPKSVCTCTRQCNTRRRHKNTPIAKTVVDTYGGLRMRRPLSSLFITLRPLLNTSFN